MTQALLYRMQARLLKGSVQAVSGNSSPYQRLVDRRKGSAFFVRRRIILPTDINTTSHQSKVKKYQTAPHRSFYRDNHA